MSRFPPPASPIALQLWTVREEIAAAMDRTFARVVAAGFSAVELAPLPPDLAPERFADAEAWWTERVVKFDYAAQLDLLARFGVRTPDARYLGWAFMLALCGWLALIAWHIGRTQRPPACS